MNGGSDVLSVRWHKNLPAVWCHGGPGCYGMAKAGYTRCDHCWYQPEDVDHRTTKNSQYLCVVCHFAHYGSKDSCDGPICMPIRAAIARSFGVSTFPWAPQALPLPQGTWWQHGSGASASSGTARGPPPPPPGLSTPLSTPPRPGPPPAAQPPVTVNTPPGVEERLNMAEDKLTKLETNMTNMNEQHITMIASFQEIASIRDQISQNSTQIQFLTAMLDRISEEVTSLRTGLVEHEHLATSGSDSPTAASQEPMQSQRNSSAADGSESPSTHASDAFAMTYSAEKSA